MTVKEIVSNSLVVISVCCAVLMTGFTVTGRTFGVQRAAKQEEPKAVRNWEKFAVGGHRIGPSHPQVTIVEFADFQCPVCQRFTTTTLRSVRERYPDQVAVIFRHWPLPIHNIAYPAAKAAECAGVQGRFGAFHDLLFQKADSLGIVPFTRFAAEANVPDTIAFRACTEIPGTSPSIEADISAAKELGGRGTPTILVNGLLLPGAPDSARFEQIIQAAIKAPRKS